MAVVTVQQRTSRVEDITLATVSQELPVHESAVPNSSQIPLPPHVLASEQAFYDSYPWCLNPYPTVDSVLQYLREEIARLNQTAEAWQLRERMTNVFLLSCAITNEIDDHLVGRRYDFSKLAKVPLGGAVARGTEKLQAQARRVREWHLRHMSAWNDRWLTALDAYLQVFVGVELPSGEVLASVKRNLATLLEVNLPPDLKSRRLRNPSFFHVRDLTHVDILRLGEKFIVAYPDRKQPIVFVGLRTAGSYFGPLLRALLHNNGYQDVESLTIRPRSAVSEREKVRISACARAGKMAVVLDEPPCSGGSTAGVVRILYKAGFPKTKVVALFPVIALYRDWSKGWGNLLDTGARALTLEPEEWHKHQMLESGFAERICQEYFHERDYVSAKVVQSAIAERFNGELRRFSDEKMHTRLKRVYEFQLQNKNGQLETRYVFAKSVGWGWLSYRAFLAGERLQKFVPPVLGLRNGILYSEWLHPVDTDTNGSCSNNDWVETIASYVASRVRQLRLHDDPCADLVAENQHKGYEELAGLLSRAFASSPASAFKRPRIQHELVRRKCPVSTLVDAKMRRIEWIKNSASVLKADFEHHAMGKRELEITDPAYDIAEAILHFRLSEADENKLVQRYAQESGDQSVLDRLFQHKLLAGIWAMNHALLNFNDAPLRHRYQEFNQRYLDAWEFMTIQVMRHCASHCVQPRSLHWRTPLVVLDVDGVMDRNVFGSFPCTTVAGLNAISLLHSHEFAIALNSARSTYEVQEYCQAYGFLGGLAEYGSAMWDAVEKKETVLVNPEALDQLEELRTELREAPGVFVNEHYRHSIRAFTFGSERTKPLPTLMIVDLMGRLNLNQLRFHQTEIDTAVIAKDVDKGTGLRALLARTGLEREQTLAVGDSDPDLDMFRVAGRSFAPSHISCRDKAAKLGCQIASRPYQPGLLEIAKRIVHPDGKHCERCAAGERSWRKSDNLFMKLLEVADRNRIVLLTQALLDPMMVKAFVK